MKSQFLAILALGVFLGGSAHAAERRPNILFILVDDYGIKDVGIEGSTFYETPHIDALARNGMRFMQGYGNCPVCSPSRASILLGKYPPRHGITDYIGAAVGEAFAKQRRVKARRTAKKSRRPACVEVLAMSLTEVLPELQSLSRLDKIRLIQFLAQELERDVDGLIEPGRSYPVPSPSGTS